MRLCMEQTLVVCALAALLVWMTVRWAGLPVVYVSYSTGECQRVWTPDDSGSCEKLPERYEHVWVE